MKKPSEDFCKAVKGLQNSAPFQVFVQHLRDSLGLVREDNDNLSGTLLAWSQGKAQCLRQLLKDVDSADDYLRRFQQNQGGES